jgi:predicted dehydrogenase
MLGCGFAARMHTPTLRALEGVSLRYASRDVAKAERFNRELGGAGAFGSYEAALASGDVDVALILTPPHLHLDLAEQALRAGKHIIVEKPPFLRSTDFERVRSLARSTNRQAMIAENYYYKPLLGELRQIVASGALGDIQFLRVTSLKTQRTADWRDDMAVAGGGALYEGGIHWMCLMANLGLTVQSVNAFRPGSSAGLDRIMLVVVRYEEGAVGTLYHSWETPAALRGLRLSRIHGTRGSVAFESNGLFLLQFGSRTRVSLPGVRDIAGYRAMFADFVDAIRAGRSPRYDLSRAQRDLELVEEAYASIPSVSPTLTTSS